MQESPNKQCNTLKKWAQKISPDSWPCTRAPGPDCPGPNLCWIAKWWKVQNVFNWEVSDRDHFQFCTFGAFSIQWEVIATCIFQTGCKTAEISSLWNLKFGFLFNLCFATFLAQGQQFILGFSLFSLGFGMREEVKLMIEANWGKLEISEVFRLVGDGDRQSGVGRLLSSPASRCPQIHMESLALPTIAHRCPPVQSHASNFFASLAAFYPFANTCQWAGPLTRLMSSQEKSIFEEFVFLSVSI